MRLDIDLSQHQLSWDELRDRARFAEEVGFVAGWVFDHFKALYGDPSGPCLEAWTLLAALGEATSRLRLGALVTGVTYRHPSVLAAEAVTVDHITNGRLELGVGAAWFDQEHRELGIDFPTRGERVRRLDEAINVIRLLMTEDSVDFAGKHYRLIRATYNPKPVQRPHPPLWIGGGGEQKMLPLIARAADVWHGFGSVRELARKSKLIDEHAEKAGRDPRAIARSTSLSISEPWDEVLRRAEQLRAAGFESLIVSWPSEGQGRAEEFVSDVMPELTG